MVIIVFLCTYCMSHACSTWREGIAPEIPCYEVSENQSTNSKPYTSEYLSVGYVALHTEGVSYRISYFDLVGTVGMEQGLLAVVRFIPTCLCPM